MSICIFSLCLLAHAQSPDEAALHKLVANRVVAWQKGDISSLMGDFLDDADHVDSSGTYVAGKKAIEEKYRTLLASGKNKGAIFKQTVARIRFIRPDVAVADVAWSASQLKDSNNTSLPDRSGSSLVVFVKHSDQWKIASLRAFTTSTSTTK